MDGMDAFNRGISIPWADFTGHHAAVASLPMQQLTPYGRTTAIPWGQFAPHALSKSALWRSLVARGGLVALPWGPIAARQSGIRIDWPVEIDPGDGGDPITVPILPVYVMIPTVSAKRLSDNAEIPILNATLQCDLDSWAWTLSAAMAYGGKALIDPAENDGPVVIEISINGYAWRMLVEGYTDNRRFGSKTLTLTGRSQSAQLAAPYAPRRTFTQGGDRNAAQLANDELFGTGWTLVWDAVDWLLPGGTLSYADLAPIEAISRLADAVGAAVHTNRTALQLQVAPSYADSPWAWPAATPYAILPAAILASGDGSWQGGQNANGVFVRSEDDSIAALVKLTGTDGAHGLDMIVDRILVHADPVRERGRIALARAGVIKTETRTLPLFPSPADPGLIPLGKLLEIQDTDETWRGMVRAIRIDAQRQGTATSVRQVLTLERQFR